MGYSIGDVERLLRVKNHVIRYWEREIPLIQPIRDMYGRREYRDRDLQIFFRLKYLLYDRRFTLEGAREQLYRELTGEYQDLRGRIGAMRSELLDLYFMARKLNNPQAGEAEEDDGETETILSPAKLKTGAEDKSSQEPV